MTLHTRLCDLLDIEHPILNAPMGGGDAPAELAAAVSEAGGLGLIGGTTRGGAPWLVEQIRRARELTARSFGVGIISHFPGAAELMAVALDEGVRVIAHSFVDPTPFVRTAHDAGALVLCQVRTVGGARVAAGAGVDAIAPIPVVAAGGIADGRGVAVPRTSSSDPRRRSSSRPCGPGRGRHS